MPLVFIHGVNVREADRGHVEEVAARSDFLNRYWLKPLASKGERWQSLEIVNPYWGGLGVQFRWDHDTLPKIERRLEHLGGQDERTLSDSDYEMAQLLSDADPINQSVRPDIEALGPKAGVLQRAARADLGRFLEAVLAPITTAEYSLAVPDGATRAQVGVREALLMEAADQVARAPATVAMVAGAAGDHDVVGVLEAAVLERFERLVRSEPSAGLIAPPRGTTLDELETLGEIEDHGWTSLRDRTTEIFDRTRDAPRRVLTTWWIQWRRAAKHKELTRFFGDVFVYLQHRGDREHPGPIVRTVLDAIQNASRRHPDEPLIVLTHSMGGNIFYDILTYFDPELAVDAWISVGGQVGQFEEMKLFKASDPAVRKPAKVSGLKPRVKYWLNVYDPVDLFGFLGQPVFADVDEDLRFLTGAGDVRSHGAYFRRPRFYREVGARLQGELA